jgi:hypothetical protein
LQILALGAEHDLDEAEGHGEREHGEFDSHDRPPLTVADFSEIGE